MSVAEKTGANVAEKISDETVHQYQEDGAVCLRGLFDMDWVERLRKTFARMQAQGSPIEVDILSYTNVCAAKDEPELMDFVLHSPAAGIAKRLMGVPDVRFYFDHIFVKEPGTSGPSPWHQDLPFWPITGDQVCSVWLALDYVTKESSGLQYVAGSHRWGKTFRAFAVEGRDHDVFEDDQEMPDIGANLDKYRLLDWDMEPGDCLVHHGLTVHGAAVNSTRNRVRRALATRWIGGDVRYRAGGGDEALLVDGLKTGDPLPQDRFPLVDA